MLVRLLDRVKAISPSGSRNPPPSSRTDAKKASVVTVPAGDEGHPGQRKVGFILSDGTGGGDLPTANMKSHSWMELESPHDPCRLCAPLHLLLMDPSIHHGRVRSGGKSGHARRVYLRSCPHIFFLWGFLQWRHQERQVHHLVTAIETVNEIEIGVPPRHRGRGGHGGTMSVSAYLTGDPARGWKMIQEVTA